MTNPAVRAGLQAILATEPDLQVVGFATDEHALWPVLERTRPAIVVLDLHHPGRDGLALCPQVKRQPTRLQSCSRSRRG
jgi:DNA-binding NarL/FixJ family response regulator